MGAEISKGSIDLTFEGLKTVGETALELMAMDFLQEAVQMANIKEGTLKSSIQAEGEGNQWIVGTNLKYTGYVHEGTKPHDIYPINAKALGPIQITGSYLGVSFSGSGFFARVHHPGYVGNPFFDNASNIVEGRIDAYIQTALEMVG